MPLDKRATMRAIVLNGRIVKMRTVFVVIEIWERNRSQLRRLELLDLFRRVSPAQLLNARPNHLHIASAGRLPHARLTWSPLQPGNYHRSSTSDRRSHSQPGLAPAKLV